MRIQSINTSLFRLTRVIQAALWVCGLLLIGTVFYVGRLANQSAIDREQQLVRNALDYSINSRLSKRTQVWIDIIGFAFFLTPLCLVVLYLGAPMVIEKFQSGEMSGNPGGLIRWPVWLALPLGFMLLLLQGLSELVKRMAYLRGEGPDPMGRLGDKSAEEELAEALRREAELKSSVPASGTGHHTH